MIAEARRSMAAQDWDQAATQWEEVRRQRPQHPGAHTEGLEALIRAYRFDEIDQVMDLARSNVGDHFQTRLFLAVLTSRLGLWREAVQAFEDMAEAFPKQRSTVETSTAYRQAVLNTYGIMEGNRRLAPLTHKMFTGWDTAPVPDETGYVFVSGMPRAGTTALGQMLNMSRDIALFTEIHIPYLTYAPESFDPSLLADRAKRLPGAAPNDMLERGQTAKLLGDKRPLFHYMLPQTFEAMRDRKVTVFHILRSVELVAVSYQRRAENPEDSWDPLRDLGNAIDELNVMHQFILDWEEQGQTAPGHKVVYVDYNRAFSDFDYAMELFSHVEISAPEAMASPIRNFIEHSRGVLGKSRQTPEWIADALHARLDKDSARKVRELTGIDVLQGLTPPGQS